MPPRVALFYDWLNQWGGAERVLLDLLALYPDAPVYTLIHDPAKTAWLPPGTKVIPSFINRLPLANRNPIFYTPLYPLALEQFDFSGFDIVIATTSVSGHCLLTPPSTLYACHLHNPNRYLYQTPKPFVLLSPLLKLYRPIDFSYSRRPDIYTTNSLTVSRRIENCYHRSAAVIYPGVDLIKFKPAASSRQGDYYLVVSRLVSHKRVDLAIAAAARLNLRLVIAGTGRDLPKLKKLAQKLKAKNITFKGKVTENQLVKLYQNCRCLICPQLEDYGLTPLEAQACGRPVIGYGQGGNTETVIDGQTGVLFPDQTVDSLCQAINRFKQLTINPADCQKQAARFSRKSFMLHFKQTIDSLWQQHQK